MHTILDFYGDIVLNLIGVAAGMTMFILLLMNYGNTVQQILNGIFL